MTRDDLISFEEDIAKEFEAGNIHAPVHLSGGNEDELIRIFRNIKPEDWVLSTWRSHYHALLKGVPPSEVKRQILAGKSMFISSVEHRFLSSAIMGGMLPIACGLAYTGDRVWCFVGDMCASIGAFHDAEQFACWNGLDLKLIVEDNGLSTNTPTTEAWGKSFDPFLDVVTTYRYKRRWPHYLPLPNQNGF